MLFSLRCNTGKMARVVKTISESIAPNPSKILKSELALLMNTMAMDFGVSPPSPEQMDIIFALLDRNNQGYFGEKEMSVLVERLIDLITLDQEQSISEHFERLISSLRLR